MGRCRTPEPRSPIESYRLGSVPGSGGLCKLPKAGVGVSHSPFPAKGEGCLWQISGSLSLERWCCLPVISPGGYQIPVAGQKGINPCPDFSTGVGLTELRPGIIILLPGLKAGRIYALHQR